MKNLRHRFPSEKGPFQKGFTVLEMLTVLVLLGIMATVAVPTVGRFLDSLETRKQTEKVLSALRYARLTAITKGDTVHVAVDEADPSVLLLSGAVNERRSVNEDWRLELEPTEILFFPEGQATPATLVFARADGGGAGFEVSLDALTGLPQVQ